MWPNNPYMNVDTKQFIKELKGQIERLQWENQKQKMEIDNNGKEL